MSSIDSAISLLNLFDRDRPALSVGEAAKLTKLPKSSTSRLFKTLESYHFVIQRGPRGTYEIGPALKRLGELYVNANVLFVRMNDFLRAQVAATGGTGYLTRLVDDGLEILEVIQGTYPIRLVHEVGTMERVDSTSAGLAMLLRLSAEEQENVLQGSPLGAERLRPILQDAGRTYTVLINSIAYPGFSALGIAVHDEQKHITYGLSLSYPDSLLSPEDVVRVRGRFAAVLSELAQISGDRFLLTRLSDRSVSQTDDELI